MDQSISSVSYSPATRGFDNKNPSLPGDSLRSTDFLQLSMTSSITTDRWNHSTTNNQPRATPSPIGIPGAPENVVARSQNATPKESKYSPLTLPAPPSSSSLNTMNNNNNNGGVTRGSGLELITPVSRPEQNHKMPAFSSSSSSSAPTRSPGTGAISRPYTLGSNFTNHNNNFGAAPSNKIQNMHNVIFSSHITQNSATKKVNPSSVPVPPPPPPLPPAGATA